jgi:hypothetical protein
VSNDFNSQLKSYNSVKDKLDAVQADRTLQQFNNNGFIDNFEVRNSLQTDQDEIL